MVGIIIILVVTVIAVATGIYNCIISSCRRNAVEKTSFSLADKGVGEVTEIPQPLGEIHLEEVFPPEDELATSPYESKVSEIKKSLSFTPDDADVIRDSEYLRFVTEEENRNKEREEEEANEVRIRSVLPDCFFGN